MKILKMGDTVIKRFTDMGARLAAGKTEFRGKYFDVLYGKELGLPYVSDYAFIQGEVTKEVWEYLWRQNKEVDLYSISGKSFFHETIGVNPMRMVEITTWKLNKPKTITTPATLHTFTFTVPKLDVSFEKEIGIVRMPFYDDRGAKVLTLKGKKVLKFDLDTRRLEVWTKMLPGIPTQYALDNLKDRPKIQPKPEDVINGSPDYITLINRQEVKDGITITVDVKEIKGSVVWKD